MLGRMQQDEEKLITRSISDFRLGGIHILQKQIIYETQKPITSSLNIQNYSSHKKYIQNESRKKDQMEHRTYYVSKVVRNRKNKDSNTMRHLIGSWKILKNKIEPPKQSCIKQIYLPKLQKHKDKKTLIFDLDETLIHSTKSQDAICDMRVPMLFPSGQLINAGVNIRPYVFEMLQILKQKFQIIIFTASHSFYADPILDALDPDGKYFHHRLYREDCTQIQKNMFVKDLRRIPRDLCSMVLIDNSAISYAFQPQNGIPIISYYYGNDNQLKQLQGYLQNLAFSSDVRLTNERTFRHCSYAQYSTPEQFIDSEYLQNC